MHRLFFISDSTFACSHGGESLVLFFYFLRMPLFSPLGNLITFIPHVFRRVFSLLQQNVALGVLLSHVQLALDVQHFVCLAFALAVRSSG